MSRRCRAWFVVVCLLMSGCGRSPARPLKAMTIEGSGGFYSLSLVCPTPDSLCLAYGSTITPGGRGTTRVRFGNRQGWISETVVDSNQAWDCRLLRSPRGDLYAMLVPSMVFFRFRSDGSIAGKYWLGFNAYERVRDADVRFAGEDTIFVAYRLDHLAMLASWTPAGELLDSTRITSTLWDDYNTPAAGLILGPDNALFLAVGISGVETYASRDRRQWNVGRLDRSGGRPAELRVESNRVLTVRNTNVEIFPVSSRGEVGSAGRLSLDLEFAPGPFHRGSFAASFGEKGVGNIAWFAFGQGFDGTGIFPMMHSRYVVHHLAFTMTRSGVAVAGQGDLGLPRTESATAVAIGSQVLAVASTDDFSKAGRIRLYRVP